MPKHTIQYLQNHDADNSADSYYALVRNDVLALLPPNTRCLLDVGCSNGATAATAKEKHGVEIAVGIELFPEAAAIARTRLDTVIEGNIEEMNLPFDDGYFDAIFCADVLEHLQNPWQALVKLRRVLAPNGVVIASIPHIGHATSVFKILFDRFEYEEYGILDKTHLRFFTLHTIKKMFDDAGFRIEEVCEMRSRSWKFALLRIATLGLFPRLAVYQYLVRAKQK